MTTQLQQFQKVKMLPFDQQIQALNSSQPATPFTYNISTAFTYPSGSFPWNMNYSKIQNPPYFSSSSCFFMPNSEVQELEDIKQVNQPTIPSETNEVVENRLKEDEKEKVVAVRMEKFIDLKFQQKYGRNIISNIFHMTIKKILSPEFSKIIQRGIKVNKLNITMTQFRERLQEKTKLMKGYINMKAIKALQIGKPIGATKLQIEFRRLLRILCRIYNHNYHLPHIYHTSKIKKQSRGLHLECLRKLSSKNKK